MKRELLSVKSVYSQICLVNRNYADVRLLKSRWNRSSGRYFIPYCDVVHQSEKIIVERKQGKDLILYASDVDWILRFGCHT